MRARLHTLWDSRSPRDRVVVAVLTAATAVALYAWLVVSGGQVHSRLQASVATLRAQAAGVEQQAVELERLRATPVAAVSQTDLRAVVEAMVEEAGLSSALAKVDAVDANQVLLVFGPVEFSVWLDWIGSLKSQHIRLSACRIEAQSAPGTVGVTMTLVRASRR